MDRHLPHEDGQLEEPTRPRRSKRAARPLEQQHYPYAPEKDAAFHESQQRPYYADEHPEIPLIKRATRHLDQPLSPVEEPAPGGRKQGRRPVAREGASAGETERVMFSATHPRRSRPRYQPFAAPPELLPAEPTKQPPLKNYRFSSVAGGRARRITLLTGSLLALIVVFVVILANAGKFLSGSGGLTALQLNNGLTLGKQQGTNLHQLVITPEDTDHPPPPVYATSAYLLDVDTNATLYASNPFLHLPMLSTTKLMTAVLAVEHGNPDEKITITPAIEKDVSQLSADSALFGFKKGETYTLREMLYGLLLPSGNDAAIAIADTLGGNLSNFVAEMNQRAQEMGLYDTHFMNPHGLMQEGQYSCAHDLALLGRFSLNVPLIKQISSTQMYTIPAGSNHPLRYVLNGNQFLFWYPGVDGGKTGYDGGSDFVQVVSVTRNHHHLIGVVMHTKDWWTDMRDLMNWGLDDFSWISPYDVDQQRPIPYDSLWNYFGRDKKENTIPLSDNGRYYIYTGYSISGLILTFFDHGGGLKAFGYPIGMPTTIGADAVSQRFAQGTIQCNATTKACILQ